MIWLTTSHIFIYIYIYTSLTTSLTYVTISLTISHVIWLTYIPNISSGWWFGTCFLLSIIYGMSSSPWTNSYVSRWLKPPTSIITIIIIIIYYYYGVKPLCLGRLSRVQDGSLGNCYYIPNYIPWPSGLNSTSPFLMGKSTISIAIVKSANCKRLPEGLS